MHQIITDLIGYIGTVVAACLMVPQVYKTYRTKSASDVSWAMILLYFLNSTLWAIYGVLIGSQPLMLANGIAIVVSSIQLVLKKKYSTRD